MDNLKHKQAMAQRRGRRVKRSTMTKSDRLRLAVYISNRNVTAQVIDDASGKTLVFATSVGKPSADANLTKVAAAVGTEIAQKCQAAKVKKVYLDRGSRKYHGRVKGLADAAREKGLEF
ncbi:50S ribosomal protein L18 [Candidatus Saccharibacteria bacterium RIFCSPLOWO2_01_FULL_48_13]|nr:MAG: 50S ribosomal protein L18 [Candidatus Saccharibacteria bacterium RIFCSPHIGHO2_01_FULL_48_12]OGL35326.1 MAG: 50S ribosomal protein L18 [Candidatus Saccharibacteria bacterium RIFCSPHIGHO2_12_FULL_48_21]OGL37561.1 MAG: 50S ribosomal protein L18 [Candidatus Saccharibacteria bacterium RIFCSPLOWO2_01_FULL_48_13]